MINRRFFLSLTLFLLGINDKRVFGDDQVPTLVPSSCERRNFSDVSVTLDNSLYYYVINQATATCNKMSDAGVASLNWAKVRYNLTRSGSIGSISLNVSGVCVSQKNLVEGDNFSATYNLPAGSGIVSDIVAKAGLQGNSYCAKAWPGSYGSFKAVSGGPSTNVLKLLRGTVTCQVCGDKPGPERSTASFNFLEK
jgi:hypothetical protein